MMTTINLQPSSRFLCLPLELRELILCHLLSSPTAAPPIWPTEITPGPAESALVGVKCHYSCSDILLSCRQLNEEIRSLVSRFAKVLPYHLDIVIAPAKSHQVTWLSLPAPLSLYPQNSDLCLDVDLRPVAVTQKEALEDCGVGRLRWYGCGGLAFPFTMLLFVLSKWLEGGPEFAGTSDAIEIDELRIHFVVSDQVGELEETQRLLSGGPCHESHLDQDDRISLLAAHFRQTWGWLSVLASSGLLFGRFKRLSLDVKGLEHDERNSSSWTIEDQSESEKRRTALSWAGYGWLPGAKLRGDIRAAEREAQSS